MPKKKETKEAAPKKAAVAKRKPLDEMTKDEMVEAGIEQDVIDDRFK